VEETAQNEIADDLLLKSETDKDVSMQKGSRSKRMRLCRTERLHIVVADSSERRYHMKRFFTEHGKTLWLLLLFVCMFILGRGIGAITYGLRVQHENKTQETAGTALENTEALLFAENWGLGFGTEGTQPTGTASAEELKEYNAYYVGDAEEKKIYLTFDCGYENGNSSAILDALKKHDAPATFFVVGHFLETAPEMVKRMVEDGHTVGNHTYHHYDMSKISDPAVFQKEMDDVRTLFQETTGTEMAMYYRPPQGKYSETNLQMAKDLGYSTFFWSLAYVDWNVDAQPSHEEAFSKLTGRIHPGAVVLLHNTSKTNGEILDELLTKWEEMGYTFGKLEELVQ